MRKQFLNRRLFAVALWTLLVLSAAAGPALAAGDLFDAEYTDCPRGVRLQSGEISTLSVARDDTDTDTMNVSWAGTAPETWGLGNNAWDTTLVAILKPSGASAITRELSLNTRDTEFTGVPSGSKVRVELAIVTTKAGQKYLISDILAASSTQNLEPPSFSAPWRYRSGDTWAARVEPVWQYYDDGDGNDATGTNGWYQVNWRPTALDAAAVAGAFYYIGYNENFGNYRHTPDAAAPGPTNHLATVPATPRLRVGLVHGASARQREDVDFDAYRLEIVDGDGDTVQGDLRTVASPGTYRYHVRYNGAGDTRTLAAAELGLYGFANPNNANAAPPAPNTDTRNPGEPRGTLGTPGRRLHNVRVRRGRDSHPAAHAAWPAIPADNVGTAPSQPASNARVRPGYYALAQDVTPTAANVGDGSATGAIRGRCVVGSGPLARDGDPYAGSCTATWNIGALPTNAVHLTMPFDFHAPFGVARYAAPLPDRHLDFPVGTLRSDETYTVYAWAVNADGETVSPRTALQVRPADTQPEPLTATPGRRVVDYLNRAGTSWDRLEQINGIWSSGGTRRVAAGTLTTTEFTVLDRD